MEFKLTREQLQNDLLYDALSALSKVMSDLQLEVFVVGALARDIAMEILKMPPSPRRTADLDVAIALKDWSQFELLKEHLLKNHFIKGEPKQRFYYQGEDGNNDYEIDIVPFGELEADEKVAWPPEGNPEMSVKCFKDVMNIADTVVIDDAITIKGAGHSHFAGIRRAGRGAHLHGTQGLRCFPVPYRTEPRGRQRRIVASACRRVEDTDQGNHTPQEVRPCAL